jgi:hypothetical protein
MSRSDPNDRFAAMEDVRVSTFGLVNFLLAHVIVLSVFGFWYVGRGGTRVAGLSVPVWTMFLLLPVVWLQFWYFIRNSEARLDGGA